jgi:hypothetical protein
MSGNAAQVLAGIAGGGTGSSLAYFAPFGTAAPADAKTALAVPYLDAGWITEDGLSAQVAESSTDIPAFGTFSPVRTIVTESKQTFDIAFLESNPVSLAVYHRLDLDGITVDDTDGSFDFKTGGSASVPMVAVFELVDGDNHVRAVCEHVEVTDRGDLNIRSGEAVTYPVTLTAFPDVNGVSVHWYYELAALVVTP